MPHLLAGIAVIIVMVAFVPLVIDWMSAFDGGGAILIVRGLSWPILAAVIGGIILYGLGANFGVVEPWNR